MLQWIILAILFKPSCRVITVGYPWAPFEPYASRTMACDEAYRLKDSMLACKDNLSWVERLNVFGKWEDESGK